MAAVVSWRTIDTLDHPLTSLTPPSQQDKAFYGHEGKSVSVSVWVCGFIIYDLLFPNHWFITHISTSVMRYGNAQLSRQRLQLGSFSIVMLT